MSESITAARSSVSIAAARGPCRRGGGRGGRRSRPRRRRSGCGRRRARHGQPERHRLQRGGQPGSSSPLTCGATPRSPGRRRARPRASPRRAARRAPRGRRSTARRSASASPKRSHGASMSPRSAHSMAQAIVPPAEIVSRPSSSQRPLASSTASIRDAAAAQRSTFSYFDAGGLVLARGRCARSRSSRRRSCRGRRRGPRRGPRRRVARLGEVDSWKLRVGERRDGVEREEVRERPELAVLRGRRAEGARAQVLRGGEDGGRVGGRDLRDGPHGDGLAGAWSRGRAPGRRARVAAVVGHRRVADQVLARGPMAATPTPRRGARRSRPSASAPRGPRGRRRLQARPVAVHEQGSSAAPRTTIASLP